MKRNKMVALMEIKRIKYSHLKVKQPQIINHSYSQWEESYYHKKDAITHIQNSNQNIEALIKAYDHNPSVYNLKMLQNSSIITVRYIPSKIKKINQCDQIITLQNHTETVQFMTATMYKLNQNVNKNFRNILFQEIKNLFQAKANVAQITNRIQRQQQNQRSFNAFNNTQNVSYTSLNNKSMYAGEDRQSSFNDVNARIEGLSMILKRMNVLVSEQGQLINQIDQNMKKGTQNMMQGRKMLEKRADREQGKSDSQFSFYGKINQAIWALYAIDVFLIVAWVLKNLV